MNTIADIFKSVIKFLNLGPDTAIVGGVLVFFWLYVFGQFPMLFGGFATTQSVQEVGNIGTQIRLSQIENTIRTYKTDLCLALQMGDERVVTIMNEGLQQQRTEYYNFTAKWNPPARYPPELSCDTLIATKK